MKEPSGETTSEDGTSETRASPASLVVEELVPQPTMVRKQNRTDTFELIRHLPTSTGVPGTQTTVLTFSGGPETLSCAAPSAGPHRAMRSSTSDRVRGEDVGERRWASSFPDSLATSSTGSCAATWTAA